MFLRDCVIATPHPTEIGFETGVGLALVLTHECDIGQNNRRHFNELFLVCPIIPLANRESKVHRAMYFPIYNTQACPEMEGGGVIYLNHKSSCAVHWITDLTAQAVCSLTAEGLGAFAAKLHNTY